MAEYEVLIMKVKFDSLNRFEVPKMFLCNPGSTYTKNVATGGGTISGVIGILHNTSDEEIVFNFNATSELNFRIYNVEVEDADENAQMIKNYTSLQNRRMIFVEDIGFFVITEVRDGSSEGKDFKDITASSCETEIEYKNIPFIEDGTYQFNPLLNKLVEVLPLWTVGHIDDSVSSKYRTFEDISEDKNVLGFMMEDMQDAYECIFIFDTINRTINVYDQNNFVVQTPIHLTKDDLINTIEIVENSEDLYTAISVLGDENLNITAINPLGTNVIYNFDYYLDWMSTGLKAKVIAWQELIKDKFDTYYNKNLDYYELLTQQNEAKFEMDKYQSQITMYTRCKENMVASGNTYSVGSYNKLIEEQGGTPVSIGADIADTVAGIKDLITEAQAKYNAAKAQYDLYTAQLEILQEEIDAIRNEVAIENYFSTDEYAELYNYIFEGNYTDEYITVTESMNYNQRFQQMKTLYDRANEQLKKVSKPTQKFSVGLENFLFVADFEEWSEQLETGCLLNIELSDDDVAALFLSTIAVNYDDKTLDFTFGNRFNKYDPKSLFKDALGNIKKSSNSINYIKDIIYPIKDGKFDAIDEAIKNSRNLTKNAVLASKNEEVLIDETGYTGRSLNDEGEVQPKQIKITGRNIVFTDDAWDTCKVAIGELILDDDTTVYGVNAEVIMGNLIFGNKLRIENDEKTVTFDTGGLKVFSKDEKGSAITTVTINPNDSSVFKINDVRTGDLLYVDQNGTLNVTGHINARSLKLGANEKEFTGKYSELDGAPTQDDFQTMVNNSIPDIDAIVAGKIPDNVLTTEDVIPGKVEEIDGGTKQTITVGDRSFDIIRTDTDDFVLLGNAYRGEDEDGSTHYTMIDTNGLLEAHNAIIYGTLYATGGEIGKWKISDGSLYTTADHKVYFTSYDAKRVLRHVAGLDTLSNTYKSLYDVSGDGKITAVDARQILQRAKGKTETVSISIDPADLDKVISINHSYKFQGVDIPIVESYFGANGLKTNYINAQEIQINGDRVACPVYLYENTEIDVDDDIDIAPITISQSLRYFDWIYLIFGVQNSANIVDSKIIHLPYTEAEKGIDVSVSYQVVSDGIFGSSAAIYNIVTKDDKTIITRKEDSNRGFYLMSGAEPVFASTPLKTPGGTIGNITIPSIFISPGIVLRAVIGFRGAYFDYLKMGA